MMSSARSHACSPATSTSEGRPRGKLLIKLSIAVADPGAGVSEQASIEQLILGSISEPAAPLLYNAAQDNLVKGNYDIGFAALDAAAVAAPSDANVVALQAFYRNATGDGAGRDDRACNVRGNGRIAAVARRKWFQPFRLARRLRH